MSELREIKCPHCSETLFSAGALAPGVLGVTRDSPSLDRDADGDFVVCPHCSRRVVIERITTAVGLPGFRVLR